MKATVMCEGHELKNVFTFKYLGSIFAADGSHYYDVKRRCGLAESRCGALNHIFNSEAIPLQLKLKVYRTAICSLLTYGSEAWLLNKRTLAMINGCNARCLSHITGLTAHEEASAGTRTLDLPGIIRQRRYRWLGHIRRMPDNRLLKEAVKVQYYTGQEGNLFMDAPKLTFDQLVERAKVRQLWRKGLPQLSQKSISTPEQKEQKAFEE